MNISVNPSVANPNFGAKVRKNNTLNTFVDGMSNSEYKTYQKTLNKLENLSPSDVLEVYSKDNSAGGKAYFIRNIDKPDSETKINTSLGDFADVKEFLNILKNVVTPKTKETDKLLKEPATKDQRSFGEKLSDFFSKGDDNDVTAYRY